MANNEFFKACVAEFINCEVLALAVLSHPECPAWVVNEIIEKYPEIDAYEQAILSKDADQKLVRSRIGIEPAIDRAIAMSSDDIHTLKAVVNHYHDKITCDDTENNFVYCFAMNPNSDSDILRLVWNGFKLSFDRISFSSELSYKVCNALLKNDRLPEDIAIEMVECANDIFLPLLGFVKIGIGSYLVNAICAKAESLKNQYDNLVVKNALIDVLMHRPLRTG